MAPVLRRASTRSEREPDKPSASAEGTGAPEGPARKGASELRRSVVEVTERIQQIIDAAERSADEIRAEAEAEAARYVSERKREADRIAEEQLRSLNDLAEGLTDHSTRLKAQADGAVRALEETVARIKANTGRLRRPGPTAVPSPPPAESAPPEPAPVIADVPEQAPVPEKAPEPKARERKQAKEAKGDSGAGMPATDEAARLRATQMAVAGSSRDEIAAALRNDFGIADPALIVDEILGSGY